MPSQTKPSQNNIRLLFILFTWFFFCHLLPFEMISSKWIEPPIINKMNRRNQINANKNWSCFECLEWHFFCFVCFIHMQSAPNSIWKQMNVFLAIFMVVGAPFEKHTANIQSETRSSHYAKAARSESKSFSKRKKPQPICQHTFTTTMFRCKLYAKNKLPFNVKLVYFQCSIFVTLEQYSWAFFFAYFISVLNFKTRHTLTHNNKNLLIVKSSKIFLRQFFVPSRVRLCSLKRSLFKF